jgi:hypothetical protein
MLPDAASSFGSVKGLNVGTTLGDLTIIRSGVDGNQVYYIHMYLGEDGIWRIESM